MKLVPILAIATILVSAVVTVAQTKPSTGKTIIISGPPSTYVAPTKATTKPAATGPAANPVFVGMKESEIPRVYKEIYKRRGISILEIEVESTPKQASYEGHTDVNKVETWNVIIKDGIIVDVIYEARMVQI